jgi:putative hydrolase of the HAD superfamily
VKLAFPSGQILLKGAVVLHGKNPNLVGDARGEGAEGLIIIDADDTLWEDSSYFEQSIEEFITFLNHRTLSHTQVRSILDEIELANSGLHPFGSRAFAQNLVECCCRLAKDPIDPADLARAKEQGTR